jgi:hypothetical protein
MYLSLQRIWAVVYYTKYISIHVASSSNFKMIQHTLFAWMELQETPHVSHFGDLPESPSQSLLDWIFISAIF